MKNSLVAVPRVAFLFLLTMSACGGQETVTAVESFPAIPTEALESLSTGTPIFIPLSSDPTPSLPPSITRTSTASIPASPTLNPNNVNPLTGLEVSSAELLNRRPMLIKVSNYPRQNRPQWGLSLADLVFEHYAEGGLTRFSALYYGANAARVGPIRSARFIDIELTRMYHAIFAYGSGDYRVRDRIKDSEFADRAVSEFPAGCPPMCRFDPANLNYLVTATADLQQHIEIHGVLNGRPALQGMVFDSQIPFAGQGAYTLEVRYSASAFARWTYDTASGKYLRAQETGVDTTAVAPLEDKLNGYPVAAANVIVIFVPHDHYLVTPEIIEIQLLESGSGQAFRDGQRYSITWVRTGEYGILSFETEAGQPFPLKPGNTWIELVGVNSVVQKPQDDAWTVLFRFP